MTTRTYKSDRLDWWHINEHHMQLFSIRMPTEFMPLEVISRNRVVWGAVSIMISMGIVGLVWGSSMWKGRNLRRLYIRISCMSLVGWPLIRGLTSSLLRDMWRPKELGSPCLLKGSTTLLWLAPSASPPSQSTKTKRPCGWSEVATTKTTRQSSKTCKSTRTHSA